MARADDIPLLAQSRQDGTAKVRADGAVGDQSCRQIRSETDDLDQVPLVAALPLRECLHRRDGFNRRDVDREPGLVASGVHERVTGGDVLDLAGEGAQGQGREKQGQAKRPGADPDRPPQHAPARREPFLMVCLPKGEITLLTCLKIRLRWASVRGGLYHGTPSSRSSNRASSPRKASLYPTSSAAKKTQPTPALIPSAAIPQPVTMPYPRSSASPKRRSETSTMAAESGFVRWGTEMPG